MFDIISIGNSELLVAVLNGLAILTAVDGPAGYGGLVALGLLIGLIIAVARGIVTQRLDIQWVLVGWMLYSVLFVPKVTVTVEDVYTGDTTVVDNVPLGVGAIGGVTSTIGITLTEAFGTAFAFPSMTTSGYSDALDIVNAMRNMDYGDANDGSAVGNSPDIDFQRTLRSYLQDCVLFDLSLDLAGPGGVSWEQLRNSTDLLADIQVNSSVWFTTTYLEAGNPDGSTQTCTDAYADILVFTQASFRPAWHLYIADQLGLDDAVVEVQEAMDALFGPGKIAQDFMLNALLKRELELAELGYHAAADNTPGVIMRTQALEQRRAQWATEQSLFLEVAVPLIAYIEAFFYAVSPFMAFLFTLGSAGITLFVRYLLLAVWIQLWMPVLAVNNLYLHLGASRKLQAIDAGGTDVVSILGMESVWTETSTWIATGGMMAAATPLLTLMLISGSYFAFTRMTDRMAGGDFVNERITAPDIMQPAAVATAGAMFQHTPQNTRHPLHGDTTYDSPSMLQHIDIGSSLAKSVESARSDQQSAVANWALGASQGLNLSRSQDLREFSRNLSSHSLSASHTQVDSVMERMSRSAINDDTRFEQMTSDERAILTGAIGASIGASGSKAHGGSGAVGGGRAMLERQLAQIESLSIGQREQIADRIESMGSSESAFRAELSEAISASSEEGEISAYARALGVSDSEEFRLAQQDVHTATRTINELSALRTSVGVNQSVPITAFGQQSSDEASLRELTGLAATHGVNMEEVARDVGVWTRSGLMHDRHQAYAASIGTHLTDGDAAARMDLARFMSERFGNTTSDLSFPVQSLESYTPLRGESRRTAEEAVSGVDHSAASFGAQVESRLSGIGADTAEARSAVVDFFDASAAGNYERQEAALREIDQILNRNRADFAEASFKDDRGLLEVIGDVDISGGVATGVDQWVSSVGYAAAAYGKARREALDGGHSEWSSQLAGLGAVGKGWSDGFQSVVTEKYDRYYEAAANAGLPDVAAQYYADNAIKYDQGIDQFFSRAFGLDEAYAARENEVAGLLGDRGKEILERASRTEGEKGTILMEGAAAIYKRDIAHSR